MIDYVYLAWKGLRHQPLRSFLTVIAVVIGIAAVFALISVIQGAKETITHELTELGANRIIVLPGTVMSNYGGDYLTDEDREAIESIPGIKYAIAIQTAVVSAEVGGEERSIQVYGIDPTNFSRAFKTIIGGYLESGRTLDRSDKGRFVIFIGNKLAHDVFDKDILPGSTIYINGKPFRVVGVMKETHTPIDYGAYIPELAFKEVTGRWGKYIRIAAEVAEGSDIESIAEKIKRRLRAIRGAEDFRVLTSKQILQRVNRIITMLGALLIVVGAISLVVGGLGIMNTMYMSVTERTREIGIMKAVGATKWQIMAIFLSEAAIIGTLGGIAGEAFGLAVAKGIEGYIQTILESYHISITPALFISLLAFSAVVGIVSGLLPAKMGADLDPVEAIRQ